MFAVFFRDFNSVFSFTVRCGSVRFFMKCTSPYYFSSENTALNRHLRILENKNSHRTDRTVRLKKQKRTEPRRSIFAKLQPRSGLRVFKIKSYATERIRCGAIVYFYRTAPHRTVRFQTSPHRTVWKSNTTTCTAPHRTIIQNWKLYTASHRRILQTEKPHRCSVLHRENPCFCFSFFGVSRSLDSFRLCRF